jgi:hypothetical protein
MDPPFPTCLYCADRISANEPVLVVEHDGERETSLASEPQLLKRPVCCSSTLPAFVTSGSQTPASLGPLTDMSEAPTRIWPVKSRASVAP